MAKNSDIDILLSARLDTDDTSGITLDISKLSKKLKDTPLDLKVNLENADLSSLKKDLSEIQKSLNIDVKDKSILNLDKSLKTANADLLEFKTTLDSIDGTLIKESEIKNSNNLVKKFTQEFSQGLGESVKATYKLNEESKLVLDTIQKTNNPLQRQKAIYGELTKLAKDEIKIKTQMLTSSGEVTKVLENQLNMNHLNQNVYRKLIESDRERNYNKEMELGLQKEIGVEIDKLQIKQAQINQKEKERIDLMGQKIEGSDLSSFNIADPNNLDNMSKYMQSLTGVEMQVTQVRDAHTKFSNGISDSSKKVYEMTATQKVSTDKFREHKILIDENTGSLYTLGVATKATSQGMMSMVQQMGNAIIKSAQWAIAMDMVYGNLRRLKEGIEIVKELDFQLTQIATVLGTTRDQVQSYADTIVQTAIDLRKSVKDVSAVTTELVRQGLSLEESQKRMEVIMKMSSVGGMTTDESLRVITSSVNALGEEAEKTADVLLKTGNISASSASQIGDAFTRVASSARANGMEIEQMSALIGALIEVTQESPSSLGNSLKSLVARFSKVNEETGELNKDLNDVQTAFESVGVAFVDGEGQIKPFYQLLQELAPIWETLDKNTRNYVSTQAAGVMQSNRFIAVMDNFNRVQDINNQLTDSAGTLARGYETTLDGVAAKADRARASFEGMWVNAINSNIIGLFYDISFAITRVIDFFGVFQVAISAAIVAMGMLYQQSVKVNGGFAQWIQSLSKQGKELDKTTKAINIQTTARMVNNKEAGNSIKSLVKEIFSTKMLGIASKSAAKDITFLAAMKMLATTSGLALWEILKKIAVALVGIAPQLLVFVGISATLSLVTKLVGNMGSKFKKTKEDTDELISSINELSNSIKQQRENIQVLRDVTSEYNGLISKMGEYRDITKLSADEQERYNSIMSEVEQIMPSHVTYVGDTNTKMLIYGKTLEDIIEKEKELVELNKEMLLAGHQSLEVETDAKRKELKKKQEELDNELSILNTSMMIKDDPMSIGSTKSIGLSSDRINKLKSEIIALRQELDGLQASQLQSLDTLMQDLDNVFNASQSMVDVAKDSVLEIFQEDGFEKASESIDDFVIILEESVNMLGKTGLEFDYTADASDRLKSAFGRLGMETGDINNFLLQLATRLGWARDGITTVVAPDMDAIEKMQQASKSMGEMYKKLASGGQLGTEEYSKLIEDNEKIAQYLAETGDMTLQNGEMLKELWEDLNLELKEYLEGQIQNNRNAAKTQKAQIESLKQEITLIDQSSKKGKKMYQDKIEQLKTLEKLQASTNAELGKYEHQLRALDQLRMGEDKGLGLDASIKSMDEAERKMNSYNNILKAMAENGGMTIDVYRTIIKEHPELLGALDDEVAMRELINEKIVEMEEVAINAYKNILMNNDSFYRKMLGENSDMLNKIADMYDLNLDNFRNMNEVMMKIASITAKQIANAYNIKISIPTDIASAPYSELGAKKATIDRDLANLEKRAKENPLSYATNMVEIQRLRALSAQLGDAMLAEAKERDVIKQVDTLMQAQAGDSYSKISLPSTKSKKTKSGGGSKAGKAGEIDLESSINLYRRWEQAIQKVNDALDINNMFLERASDKDRISLIEKENKLLKEKQKLLNYTNNQYRQELSVLTKSLAKRGIDVASPTFGISDIENIVKSAQVSVDKLTSQINAISSNTKARESLVEQRNVIKDDIDDLIKEFDRHITVTNTISDKSNEWWEIQSQILDNQIQRIESGLAKYGEKLTMLNQQMTLLGEVRMGRPDEVARELELLDMIASSEKDKRKEINDELYTSTQQVKKLEERLESFGEVRNEQYAETHKQLQLARHYNKYLMDEFMEATVDLSVATRNATNKRIDEINHERDEILKTIDVLLEMEEIYNNRTLITEGRDIQHRIDLLNKQFQEGANFRLGTTDVERDLNNINKYYNDLKSKYDKMKAESTVETEIDFEKESIENSKDKIALLEEQMKKQAELIRLNEEDAIKLREEIEDLAFEYKQIEASLQNRIDLKEDELNLLREQHRREEKISQQMEKQLELLRALDDRRFSYITGTGEEVFTYDVNAVNKLRQEMSKMQSDERKQKAEELLADEIKTMKENLQKTIEINQIDIEIRRLQLTALEENTNAMKNLLEGTKQDFENVYENLGNQLIDEWKKTMSAMIESYEIIYKEYLNRKSYEAPEDFFRHQGKGDKYYNFEDLARFDSGGYTGSFDGGRVAMLHEKELILDKDDTKNTLDIFSLAKDMINGFYKMKFDNLSLVGQGSGDLYVKNVNLPNVKDGKSFVNELQSLLRKGQNRLM